MEHIPDDEDDHLLTSISILFIDIRQHVYVFFFFYFFFFHVSSYQIVNSVCWSHSMANGPNFEEDRFGWWSMYSIGQLLIMWSAICSVHTHMPHCPPVPTSSWMLCTDRPQFAACLVSTVFSAQIFSIDAFSWARYVAVYSGGSGCFPLLLPRCRNPCLLRPILRDYTYLVSPEPPCFRVYGSESA